MFYIVNRRRGLGCNRKAFHQVKRIVTQESEIQVAT